MLFCYGLMCIFVGGFQFSSTKNQNGKFKVGDLLPLLVKLKAFREMYTEDEITGILGDQGSDFGDEIDFEGFLRVSLRL